MTATDDAATIRAQVAAEIAQKIALHIQPSYTGKAGAIRAATLRRAVRIAQSCAQEQKVGT